MTSIFGLDVSSRARPQEIHLDVFVFVMDVRRVGEAHDGVQQGIEMEAEDARVGFDVVFELVVARDLDLVIIRFAFDEDIVVGAADSEKNCTSGRTAHHDREAVQQQIVLPDL